MDELIKYKDYDSHELNVNGQKIVVWTDGNIVRIMSMDHLFVEIALKQDLNYSNNTSSWKGNVIKFLKKEDFEV